MTADGGLAAWAEHSGRRGNGALTRGSLRFAFYGRVSTEDWQDPVTSRARQRAQAEALVRGYGVIVAELFDVGESRTVAWSRRPQAATLVAQLADPGRGWDAIVMGEYERAFYGSQYAAMAPLFEHYGVQLWMPETGGGVDYQSEHDEKTMTVLGLARRLILVCAPAGSGKTALLADWAPSGNRPVAWLSLDAADNDPVRFWRHTVAALDRARPGIAERAGLLLGPPAPASFEGLVTALINELAAQRGDGEVLLVLDDYHLIDAQPVHASLAFLPPGLHLVLASRADPPLPLARLRAGGQLAELRAGELRFTAEEAAALLREAAGRDLPAAAVAALADRTEGWVAGLQLAALSLAGAGGSRWFRGGVQRQPPLCPGLPGRGGAGPPAGGAAHLPAGNLAAGTPVRRAV